MPKSRVENKFVENVQLNRCGRNEDSVLRWPAFVMHAVAENIGTVDNRNQLAASAFSHGTRHSGDSSGPIHSNDPFGPATQVTAAVLSGPSLLRKEERRTA